MAVREDHTFLFVQILDEVRLAVHEVSSLILHERGCLERIHDMLLLTVESLKWTKERLHSVISQQKEVYEMYSKFKPPVLLTSEGECANIHPDCGNVPLDARPGIGVSAGIAEGIAKVVTDPTSVVLHTGEFWLLRLPILDGPLSLSMLAVVMLVGGYLTSGLVVSREYDLPADACVANATSVIKTGVQLRVYGTRGNVEVIS
jgi:pyruvate,water dikinase